MEHSNIADPHKGNAAGLVRQGKRERPDDAGRAVFNAQGRDEVPAKHERDLKRDNPILKGLRWLRVFADESVRTYAQVAEILGVSRERVYQRTIRPTFAPTPERSALSVEPDLTMASLASTKRPVTSANSVVRLDPLSL